MDEKTQVPPSPPAAPTVSGVVASEKKKNPLVVAVVIFISLIVLFLLARFLIPQALVYLTRATKSSRYSLSNSYLFGSPLAATADGKTKVRVSAFLLDDQGLGVADKQISLRSAPKTGVGSSSLKVEEVQPVTDSFGKAVFEVTSGVSGQFVVTALIDGVEFPQTITLTFR